MNRILFADKQRRLQQSRFAKFVDVDDFVIIGRATSPAQVISLLKMADMTFLNVNVAGCETDDLIGTLLRDRPKMKIVVVDTGANPDTILRHIEAGATGFILSDDSADEAVRKSKAVLEDRAHDSPEIAAALMTRVAELAKQKAGYPFERNGRPQLRKLSPRQREVLGLIAEGYGNREIAKKLFIQYGTVKNHVSNILKKLDVNDRHEAASLYRLGHESGLQGAVARGQQI